jgi:hypothetical protein
VTLTDQGKGDHKSLCRDGYRFTLAPKYRDDSAPLSVPISMKLIKSLNIPLQELNAILEKVKP